MPHANAKPIKVAALIVGAGCGARAGGKIPKQYQILGGVPVFRRTLLPFCAHPRISQVIAVIDDAHQDYFALASDGLDVSICTGGATRTASVRAGLEALAGQKPDMVLIHDAARPFISATLIKALIEATTNECGAAPVLPVVDALKFSDPQDGQLRSKERAGLVLAQTPQAFPFTPLLAAYQTLDGAQSYADDIALAQAHGIGCTQIAGDVNNFKLTYAADFERAQGIVNTGVQARVGMGFDVHRLIAGPYMMLCGVRIDGTLALEGHSDADVGLHALTDALLGAIGAGDIGDHFPPEDPQWRGASSDLFVQKALSLVAERGAQINNVDVTLICERPKIKPHRAAMRARIAQISGLEEARISIKATTTEKLGFCGREEGLAAMAVVSLAL